MRRLVATIVLLVATSPAAMAVSQPPSFASGMVSVQVDRTTISTSLGARFSFTSTVRNRVDQPISGLIAHLNVFSTDPHTYVDPEDWSSHRTQFLDRLPAHGSTTLTWRVQVVNGGPLVLYVAVTDTADRTVTVSTPIELTVKKQQTINAGGILPLALGVPGAVATLLVVVLLLRRRHTRVD